MQGKMILYYAGVLKMTPAFFWVMIPLRGGTIPETKKKAPWEIHRFQVDPILGEWYWQLKIILVINPSISGSQLILRAQNIQ